MRLEIKSEIKRLERDLGRIADKVIPVALPPAVNRVTNTVRATAVKDIAKTTGIKPQKDVREKITIKKASVKNPTAWVDAKAGRAFTLRRFITPARRVPSAGPGKPQFFRKRTGRAGSRSFKYSGIEHKAWNRRKILKGTFIAKGRSGNAVPMMRLGDDRNARLKVLRGPSIRREFNRPPMRNVMTAKANERFPIEIDRSVKQALRRYRR